MSRKTPGVRRHGTGWQAYVMVRGQRYAKQFDLTTPLAEMVEWRRLTRERERRTHPKPTKGTLAADVDAYLPTLADRPKLQQARALHLAWWVQRFGHRRRSSITRAELITALAELASSGYAPSTVKKYRTALFHLYTTLDGKDAPNPLRDIPPPKEADPEPRWIPYAIIDALLAAIGDYRYRGWLTNADVLAIRTQAAEAGVNLSSIARHFNVSESTVRHIRDGRWKGRGDELSKGKAVLKAMAFIGLAPAHIAQLRPETDIDWQGPSLLVRGRQKGQGGGRTTRVPLTPDGEQALRDLITARAIGISQASVAKLFHRAVDRLVGQLAATDWRLAKEVHQHLKTLKATPYSMRHSFLTEAQLAGGDIRATQALATHQDIRQTMRYTLAAVDPRLKAVADLLSDRLAKRPALTRPVLR